MREMQRERRDEVMALLGAVIQIMERLKRHRSKWERDQIGTTTEWFPSSTISDSSILPLHVPTLALLSSLTLTHHHSIHYIKRSVMPNVGEQRAIGDQNYEVVAGNDAGVQVSD